MCSRVKFSFTRGPCLGKEIIHDFDEGVTVAHLKKFLIEVHRACDAQQSLVFVWNEQKLNDEDQHVSSLGQNISITVNVKKRDACDQRPTQPSPPPLPLPSPPPPSSGSGGGEAAPDSVTSVQPKSDFMPCGSDAVLPSVQAASAEMKSYTIRLRKVDQQCADLRGSLPADCTLQAFADEIVKLGHAAAGSFSLVLPPVQGCGATVYEPKDFATPLATTGIFDKRIVVSLQNFGRAQPAASAAKKLGAVPPLPHKVPVPPNFQRHVDTSAIRRAAELALPTHQQHWGLRRFCDGNLEEEKKGCVSYFEREEREMTELLNNIWKGSTWPDATCKSKFAKVACQLIVEQMHLILASAEPGSDGPNHKGQLLQECDLAICKHSGQFSTQQHWSCCGHKRHEPCICPAVPAPPQGKGDSLAQTDVLALFQQQVSLDAARLLVSPETCNFPGANFEEKKRGFIERIAPQLNLNAVACEEFLQLTMVDLSREWDMQSAAALCPADSSNKTATAEFLVGISQRMKDPSALESDTVEALLREKLKLEEQMKGLGGLLGSGGGDGGVGDKKTRSKYQFK